MSHTLTEKNLTSVTVYGDALTGGYDGTRESLYNLIKGIADGAMLIDVGNGTATVSSSKWSDGEYDLTSVFPTNRYSIISVDLDFDHATGTQIAKWYDADIVFQEGNILSAKKNVPDEDLPVVVVYVSMTASIESVPVYTGELTYNGSAQYPTFEGYDPISMTMGGDTEGTDAGEYVTTFTPKKGYQWSDGTKLAKSIPWVIKKQHKTLEVSENSVFIFDTDGTATITILEDYSGVQVASSDESVATVEINDDTVTITRVGDVRGNVTVSIFDDSDPTTERSAEVFATCGVFVYGATWAGGESSAWERTDDSDGLAEPVAALSGGMGSSPFDNIMPWAGMQVVEDDEAGTLVSIPKYYYKWTRSGSQMGLQISMVKGDGFLTSPAHADRGDGKGERDIAYYARFKCNGTYKSESGTSIKSSMTRAELRTAIHKLGSTIYQNDFAMYWTVMMLYLVEYADWDGNKTIGCGRDRTGGNVCGETDAMKYHTGTMGDDRSVGAHLQYRHIEDLWGFGMEFLDGIYFGASSYTYYCINNPANFRDSGGTSVSTGISSNGQWYPTSMSNPTKAGFEYALFPTGASRTALGIPSSTYIYNTYPNLYFGSDGASTMYGPFSFSRTSHSSAYAFIFGRLQKLP